MQTTRLRPGCKLLTVSALVLTACATAVNCEGQVKRVRVVNMIPQALSNEVNSDSEPNIAVNLPDPLQIAASAFTPNTSGIPNVAPIYLSTDGGMTWTLSPIVPVIPGNRCGGGGTTCDITLRFGGTSGILYVSWIDSDSAFLPNVDLHVGRVMPFSMGPFTLLQIINGHYFGSSFVDQPYTQAATFLGSSSTGRDRVYIGGNDLRAAVPNGGTGKTAIIDQSLDAANTPAAFNELFIEARTTCNQDGPSIRPAIHASGTIYAAFFRWTSTCGSGSTSTRTADVVVVRDDNWGFGAPPSAAPFTALLDSGQAGKRVVTGRTIQWTPPGPSPPPQEILGNERIGSQISLAVNPGSSKEVYLAWADGAPANNYTIHVSRSFDGGATWTEVESVSPATNPALAINSRGRVGFLYQKFVDPGTCHRVGGGTTCWETHLEISDRKGRTFTDLPNPLANVPDDAGNFPLGDYNHLMAVGEDFYGVFSANNYADMFNFYPGTQFQRFVDFGGHQLYADAGHTIPVNASVDPFFFEVPPDPCERQADAAAAVKEEIQDLKLALSQLLPLKTPAQIAKLRAAIVKRQGQLAGLLKQLNTCRQQNPW